MTAAAAAAGACVGDAPQVTPDDGGQDAAPGTEGNLCFPNGTCLGTLQCLSNRCVQTDAGSAGDAAVPTNDATLPSGDAGVDAAGPGDASDVDASDAFDAGECGVPYTITANPTIFCPFADSGTIQCTAMQQHCCEAPINEYSVCAGTGTACGANYQDWECQQPSHCGSGQVCCGTGTPTVDPICNHNFVTQFVGTACATSCTSTQFVVCITDADCANGKTCRPSRAKGVIFGVCE